MNAVKRVRSFFWGDNPRHLGACAELVISVHMLTTIFIQDAHYNSSDKWKDVGFSLGLSDSQIHEIDRKEDTSTSKTNAMLEKWVSRKGKMATIKKLTDVLYQEDLENIRDQILDRRWIDHKVVFRGQFKVNNNTIAPPPQMPEYSSPVPVQQTMPISYPEQTMPIFYSEPSRTWEPECTPNPQNWRQPNTPKSQTFVYPEVHSVHPIIQNKPFTEDSAASLAMSLQSMSIPTAMEVEKQSEDLVCSTDEFLLENIQCNPYVCDMTTAKKIVSDFSGGRLQACKVSRVKSALHSIMKRPMKVKTELAKDIKIVKKKEVMVKEMTDEMIKKMKTNQKFTQYGFSVRR